MASADEFLAQYEPSAPAAVSAEAFLSQYKPAPEEPAPEPAKPSFFANNRGGSNTYMSSSTANDAAKSFGSHAITAAINSPLWLADTGNLANTGLQKGYEYYRDISGSPLSLAQEKAIESYRPFMGSDEIGMGQIYEPKTKLGVATGVLGDITGFTGAASAGGRIGESLKPSPPPIDADLLKETSQKAYKFADEVGGKLNGNFSNDVRGTLESAKIKPIGQKPLTKSAESFNNKIDELMPLEGESWTLDDFQRFDKLLTREKSSLMDGFKHTEDSRSLSVAQQQIRNRLQAISEKDVLGGKAGFDALTKEAIPTWAAKTRMDDLEYIINRANMMDNPSIGMRTGFRNLILNKAKFATYPEEVQKLIRKAAVSGKADDLLGVLGSRLNAIGGGIVGGVPGQLVGHATSSTFRRMRNALKNREADRIMNALTEPLRPIVEKYKNPIPAPPKAPEPMRLLPAPRAGKMMGDESGNITPVNVGEHDANYIARQNIKNTQKAQLSASRQNEFDKALAQKEAGNTVPTPLINTGGKTIEEIIAENADRNDLGTMAQAFMNLGKNQRGNIGNRAAIATGLAGAAGMALKPEEKSSPALKLAPAKYKNMEELLNNIPELKPKGVPQSFQSEEGFKPHAYKDTTGHRTVGIGFNMDSSIARDVWKSAGINKDFNAVRSGKTQITKGEANKLLSKSYDIAQQDIRKLVPNIEELSPMAQEALTHLAYQHGRGGLKDALPGVLTSAKMGNMKAAAARLLSSGYGKTYKNRAVRLAKMMAG